MAAEKINDKTTVVDHVAEAKAREKAEQAKIAGARRKAAVQALETELAYLERQPKVNERRVGEVKAELVKARKSGGRQTAAQD